MWIIGGFNHETSVWFIHRSDSGDSPGDDRVQVARSHIPLDELVQNMMYRVHMYIYHGHVCL